MHNVILMYTHEHVLFLCHVSSHTVLSVKLRGKEINSLKTGVNLKHSYLSSVHISSQMFVCTAATSVFQCLFNAGKVSTLCVLYRRPFKTNMDLLF